MPKTREKQISLKEKGIKKEILTSVKVIKKDNEKKKRRKIEYFGMFSINAKRRYANNNLGVKKLVGD